MASLPEPVVQWLAQLEHQQRYSSHTISAYRQDLQRLIELNPELPLHALQEDHIRRSIARLHSQGNKPRSLARALAAWRGFYQWCAQRSGLSHNPAAGVKAPKMPRQLPKALSVEQAARLLDRPGLPTPSTAVELRDRAMFEVIYSGGLRLSELVSLDYQYTRETDYESTSWIDLANCEALVKGKGGKTRSAPLGKQALQALQKWLEVRPQWLCNTPAKPDDTAALFLGVRGQRISPRVVQKQLNAWAQQCGLPLNVHPHSLRHSFASHLLQSSQDLRAVQELLGHANIATTQIYTRLDFQHLAKVYDQAHPRANRKPGKGQN